MRAPRVLRAAGHRRRGRLPQGLKPSCGPHTHWKINHTAHPGSSPSSMAPAAPHQLQTPRLLSPDILACPAVMRACSA